MNKTINDAVEELKKMQCSNDSCKAFSEYELEQLTKTLTEIDKQAREEEGKKYSEIFKWLLGESGDFPQSEKGKRYGFRTELREITKPH